MKIGFIGCGNMGSAIARACARDKSSKVYLYDTGAERAKAVAAEIGAVASDLNSVCECDVIFLAVKPNIIPVVATETAGLIKNGSTLVSMAAGVTLSRIGELFGDVGVIRIMPNTPAAIGEGMVLWCKNDAVDEDRANAVCTLLANCGRIYRLDESLIDAGTAVSGCGPAFVYMFIDAMINGGVNAGLSREAARELAAQTVLGAAAMVQLAKDTEPDALREAVCSPGGSTIEGVKMLKARDFYSIVEDAVAASYKRTQELGK